MHRFQPRPKHIWLSTLLATLTTAVIVVVLSAFRAVELSPITLIGEHPALMGAAVCLPMVVALLWASGRLRKGRGHAYEEGSGATASDATLREDLERIRLILDSTLDAVVGMDSQGAITDWNARAEAMFGWTREEAIGRKLAMTIIPPRYLDAHERGFQRFLSTGEGPFLNRRVEITALRRDGTEFPIELTISALKMGGSYVFSSFIADITERKRMESDLQKSEQQFRTVFSEAPIGISMVDRHYRFIRVNTAFCRLLGYSEQELIGRTFMDITHPDDRDDNVGCADRMFAGELPGYQLTKRYVKKDGSLAWVHLTAITVKDPVGGTLFGLAMTEDVTATREAEEALRDSQERFRKAFSEAPIGMALCAIDGRWLQVNRALCQIVGYAEHELLATNFQAITHPDDLEADLALARQLLNGDIPHYEMEKRYIHKLGHVVWIRLTGSIVRDAKGAPLYFIAQIQDITIRKQAEAALHETQTRLETIFRSSPLPILVMEPDGRIMRWNRSAERVFGWTEQEVLGEICPTVPETDLEDFHWMIAQALQDGNLHNLSRRRRKKDGTVIQANISVSAFHGSAGHPEGVVAILEDVTERRRAEEVRERLVAELAESRNRFEMFFRQTPSPIAITTVTEGRFLDVNRHAEILTGYSREELLGRTTVEMNLYVDPTDRPKIVQQLSEKGLLTDIERLVRTKSGEIRTAIFSLVPIQIGSEPCLLSIAHDITERRKAEEALRSNEQVLRTLLKEREQLMQDLHDGIIQSLYAIGMSVDECRRLMVEDPDKAGMKLGQTVGDINRVIREVRQHLAQGEHDLPFSAHRLKTELTRVAATMERANALHFRLTVDPRAAECLTSEERKEILYIAQETMSNCLRHSGAKIATVSLRLGRDRVCLEVEDDGKGFETTVLLETNGGLRNIERRAEKVGARVEIVSRRDHGTRIRLSVPIHA